MKSYFKRLAVAAATLALFVAAGRNATAQGAGTLRGIVTDPSPSLVPNATVVVSGKTSRTAKSDGQGRYTFANLPVGTYTLRADAPGFVTFIRQDVEVTAGQAISLNVALSIAAEAQQVQVADQGTGEVSVDSSSNVGALVLTADNLSSLSEDPDDLQADLQALAGPSSGPSGAQFFVDGFSGGQLPPKSSIREVRINSNPFSSEFDRPGFGRIEVLTRPGADNYHGRANVDFSDKALNTRNPLLTTEPPAYRMKFFSGNLGGPLNKRTSFTIDFNRRDVTENALVNALQLDSNFNATPFNQAVLTPNSFMAINPRLDYQLNANNTLVMRYQHNSNSNTGGVGQFSLPTQTTKSNGGNDQIQVTETAVIGSTAVDETRVQFRNNRNDQRALGDFSTPGIDVTSSFNSGGAPYSTNFNHSKGLEVQNFVTMTRGVHVVKAGFRARQNFQDSQSTSNQNGSYSFSSFALYQGTQRELAQGKTMTQVIADGFGPSQLTLVKGTPLQSVDQFDIGLYLQDDWRIKPNFTLNLGLRYETQNNIGDRADWAPRLGFAWAPGAKGKQQSKTVFRGGVGFFYDRFEMGNTLNTLRFNGVNQQNYLITAGAPNAAQALASYPGLPPVKLLDAQNQAVYRVDSNFKAPLMRQAAIGIDRQLPWRSQLSVNFVNTRGVHVQRQRNVNAPLPNGVRPFAGQGDIYLYESSGIFKQTQLMLNASTRVSSRIQLQGFYTYARAHSNADGFPMDQYNTAQDWARANFDVRHRAFVGGTVTMPLRLSVAPFVTMNSGAPFNITSGQEFNGDGIFNVRPAFATATVPADCKVCVNRFGSFVLKPPAGTAVIPRNYGEGPAQFSVNLRLSRSWGWGERAGAANARAAAAAGAPGPGGPPGGFGGGRGGFGGGRGGGGFGGGRGGGGGGTGKRYNVTASIQARNAFNHTNLGQPVGSLASPLFGTSTQLAGGGGGFGGGGGASGAGNRRVELQLSFNF